MGKQFSEVKDFVFNRLEMDFSELMVEVYKEYFNELDKIGYAVHVYIQSMALNKR